MRATTAFLGVLSSWRALSEAMPFSETREAAFRSTADLVHSVDVFGRKTEQRQRRIFFERYTVSVTVSVLVFYS